MRVTRQPIQYSKHIPAKAIILCSQTRYAPTPACTSYVTNYNALTLKNAQLRARGHTLTCQHQHTQVRVETSTYIRATLHCINPALTRTSNPNTRLLHDEVGVLVIGEQPKQPTCAHLVPDHVVRTVHESQRLLHCDVRETAPLVVTAASPARPSPPGRNRPSRRRCSPHTFFVVTFMQEETGYTQL